MIGCTKNVFSTNWELPRKANSGPFFWPVENFPFNFCAREDLLCCTTARENICQTACRHHRFMGSKVQVIPNGVSLQEFMAGKTSTAASSMDDMTSADYYADSYGHFGIHGTHPRIMSVLTWQRRC